MSGIMKGRVNVPFPRRFRVSVWDDYKYESSHGRFSWH